MSDLIERLRDRYSKHSQELRDEAADALEQADKRIEELEALLYTGYDLVAESVGGTKQYDFEARAHIHIKKAKQALAEEKGDA